MLAKGKQYIRLATNSLLHDDNIECYLLKLVRSISITIYERKTHQGGIHQAKTFVLTSCPFVGLLLSLIDDN